MQSVVSLVWVAGKARAVLFVSFVVNGIRDTSGFSGRSAAAEPGRRTRDDAETTDIGQRQDRANPPLQIVVAAAEPFRVQLISRGKSLPRRTGHGPLPTAASQAGVRRAPILKPPRVVLARR